MLQAFYTRGTVSLGMIRPWGQLRTPIIPVIRKKEHGRFYPFLSVPAKELFSVEEPKILPFQMRPMRFCLLQRGSRFSVPSSIGKYIFSEHDPSSALLEVSLKHILQVTY